MKQISMHNYALSYQPALDAALDAVRVRQTAAHKPTRTRRCGWLLRLLRPCMAAVGDLLIVLGCRLKGSVGGAVPLQSLAQLQAPCARRPAADPSRP